MPLTSVKTSALESMTDVTADIERLEEAEISTIGSKFVNETTGNALIRIIKPGWGSSGYYSDGVLSKEAAKVYKSGTHMHIDHPTMNEDQNRPERSIKTLAGVITEGGHYLPNGSEGPGVYAKVHIFSPYRKFLNEMAPHIGLSHRAMGKTKMGEADGRKGKIVETLDKCLSVDFVTIPGAGGQILPLYESYREHAQSEDHEKQKEDNMDNLTIDSLKESKPDLYEKMKEEILNEVQNTEASKLEEAVKTELLKENESLKKENARLLEMAIIREAAAYLGKSLEKAPLPDVTKARLMESIPTKATIIDGKLDEAAFKVVVEESIKTESEYVSKIKESGKVRGFGGSAEPDTSKVLLESYKQSYMETGKSEKDAETLAKLAINGR
jgi:hypothetical protein